MMQYVGDKMQRHKPQNHDRQMQIKFDRLKQVPSEISDVRHQLQSLAGMNHKAYNGRGGG